MNPILAKVEKILKPVVENLDYELIGLEYGSRGRGMFLRVYIDNEVGIQLSDCEAVSRRIGAVLDVEDVIAGHYDLEVSSPGFDRPLFKEEHYRRFISRRIKVVMARPQSGRRRFTGILQDFSSGQIIVESDNEVFELPFADVASARLVPEFNMDRNQRPV